MSGAFGGQAPNFPTYVGGGDLWSEPDGPQPPELGHYIVGVLAVILTIGMAIAPYVFSTAN